MQCLIIKMRFVHKKLNMSVWVGIPSKKLLFKYKWKNTLQSFNPGFAPNTVYMCPLFLKLSSILKVLILTAKKILKYTVGHILKNEFFCFSCLGRLLSISWLLLRVIFSIFHWQKSFNFSENIVNPPKKV